jgi:hypothetical protein
MFNPRLIRFGHVGVPNVRFRTQTQHSTSPLQDLNGGCSIDSHISHDNVRLSKYPRCKQQDNDQ